MVIEITKPEAESQSERAESPAHLADPIATAVHLRQPQTAGVAERFDASDPAPAYDVTANPRVARLVRNRKLQFFLILPNQIIFWTVIFVGILGTAVPGLNFGAAITWYVWFCLVFVLMVVVGRAWCAMCPFGGFAEWIQRRTFFRRTTSKPLTLGLKFPEPLAQMGFLLPVAAFLLLTWIEEYFNIAGPGNPAATSFMVIGIVLSAVAFFLVFERRTFCRYVCPLTSLIGTVGSMGSVAGFRTRDRDVCLNCSTKDCMRGSADGFGCPWYTWPGSADSNLYCGLCTECYKSCPEGNIGLFVQKPLTSVVAPRRRRADVAWAIAVLWGLVFYQQFNATNAFATIDDWLNKVIRFPHYPNPFDYLGIIVVGAAVMAGFAWLTSVISARRDLTFDRKGGFTDRMSRFRTYFVPMAYGLIPLVGADYFARQLPKFLQYSPRVVPAVGRVFGAGSTHSSLYNFNLTTNGWIVVIQVAVIALGAIGSLWATTRIANRELAPVSGRPVAMRVLTIGFVVVCSVAAAWLYVIMQAAD